MGVITKFVYGLVLLYLFYYFFGVPVRFSLRVKTIKDVANHQSGVMYSEKSLRKNLHDHFGDYILDSSSSGWIPFHSGGLHGYVSVLYASFTEFLVLYHAEMDTTGSAGRHFMNVSTTVLKGQMTYSMESGASPITLKELHAGENYVLRVGETAQVKLTGGTILLVYGRGFVPVTMGYWIAYTLLINHDPLLVITILFTFLQACCFSKGSLLYGFGRLFLHFLDYIQMLPNFLQTLGNSAYQYLNKLLK